MRTKVMLSMVAILAVAAGAVFAQAMEPKKYKGDWYEIYEVDFKSGQMEAAIDLIENYFAPAGMKSGDPGPLVVLIHHTGEWDMTAIFKLEGGPGDMAWEIAPDDVKFMTAMAEIAGGPDKAQEVWAKWESLVARSSTTIARSWQPPEAPSADEE
jgi:hypothetical protein